MLVTGSRPRRSSGRYRLEGAIDDPTYAALGFRLGAYRFDRYKTQQGAPELVMPKGPTTRRWRGWRCGLPRPRPHQHAGQRSRARCVRARDPRVRAARKMKLKAIVGDDLLKQNFPMIHAVGRAAPEAAAAARS